MPDLDRVGSRRQPLDLERTVGVADREVRMLEDTAVRRHPAMHVAPERHHHFVLIERPRRLHALRGLAEVELGIGLRNRMDVVERGIAVENDDGLADLDAKHMRVVLAALLVEHDRRLRRGELEIAAQAVLHVDEGVLDAIIRSYNQYFRGLRALGHAQRVRVHANHARLLGRAFVFDRPGNRALTGQRCRSSGRRGRWRARPSWC